MSLLRRIGAQPTAWALRRFHTPVGPDSLVLEVGSGGNPYPRANVLLDAYETSRERHWAPLASDRPTVLGFVENLPFRTQAFDFVIAAHVLEHSSQPSAFIGELERVAKAGYIEVPDALLERLNPYRDHRLEITCRNQTLVIRKKASWRNDPVVVDLYEDRAKPVFTRELVPRFPFEFHVRYYWENKVNFHVVNPDVDAAWPAPVVDAAGNSGSEGATVRRFLREALRGVLSQRVRNASIDLLPLLRCTSCHGTDLQMMDQHLKCTSCGASFPVRNGVPVMNEGQAVHA
jgi:uncharacterized protein YbaR (Trm112 family)